jgi:hypothetical protein
MSAQLSPSARRANTSVRWCGVSTLGRPKRTPRAFARLRPSPVRLAANRERRSIKPTLTDRLARTLKSVGAISVEDNLTRKILTALIAAASVGATAIACPSPAKAWWGWGPAVAGGVVAGAIVGGAIASTRPYYPPPYYYGPYYGPYPYYGPRCGRVWNGYAWVPAC